MQVTRNTGSLGVGAGTGNDGTGAATRVTFWKSTTTIGGDALFTYDAANGRLYVFNISASPTGTGELDLLDASDNSVAIAISSATHRIQLRKTLELLTGLTAPNIAGQFNAASQGLLRGYNSDRNLPWVNAASDDYIDDNASTANATPQASVNGIALPNNTVGDFTAEVLVKGTTGPIGFVLVIEGTFKNQAGVVTQEGTTTAVQAKGNAALATAAVAFTIVGSAVKLTYTGIAATNITWRTKMKANYV